MGVKKLGSCRCLSVVWEWAGGVGVGHVPGSGECSKQGMERVKVDWTGRESGDWERMSRGAEKQALLRVDGTSFIRLTRRNHTQQRERKSILLPLRSLHGKGAERKQTLSARLKEAAQPKCSLST